MATTRHPKEYEQRDPEEIERDIARTRRAIDSTVEELGQRLAPSQLVDDARSYVKETAVRGVNTMWTRMSDNAVPLGLIGGGVLWMMASRRSRHDGSGLEHRYAGYEGYEEFEGHESGGLRERASGLAEGGAERAREMAHRVRERGHELRERGARLGGQMSEEAHRVRERGHELRERGARLGGQMSEEARYGMRRARESFDTMRWEQPLLLGICALAAGAMLGSMIPSSRREDELVGEMRDQVVGAAAEKGAAKLEQAREAAERTVQESRSQGEATGSQPQRQAEQAGGQAPVEGGI